MEYIGYNIFVEHDKQEKTIRRKLMIKITFFTLYRFFTNGKNLAAIFAVIMINLLMMNAFCSYNPPAHSAELQDDENNVTFTISSTVSSVEEYSANADALVKSAEFYLGSYKDDDSPIVRYEKKIVEIYSEIGDKITLADSDFTDTRYFLYTYDALFLTALLLIFLISAYIDDYSLAFLPIVRATQNGRKTLARAKLIASLIYIITISVLMSAVSVLICPDAIPWNSPVQSLTGMALCVYDITVLEYFIIVQLCKTAVMITLALVFLPFIIWSYNTAFSVIAAAGICAMQLYLSISPFSTFSAANYMSLYTLFDPSNLFSQYRTVMLFGKLIDASVCFAIIIPTAIVLMLPIYFISFIRRNTVLGIYIPQKEKIDRIVRRWKTCIRRSGNQKKCRCISTSKHELHKIFVTSGFRVMLALLLIVRAILSVPDGSALTTEEKMYRKYLHSYEGEYHSLSFWTEYKDLLISEYACKLDTQVKQLNEAEKNHTLGLITDEQYDRILIDCEGAYERHDIFEKIERYSDYLRTKTEEGRRVSFVFDGGWNEFFTRDADYILYIAIVLIASYIFTIEHDSSTSSYQTASIVRATPNGRKKLFRIKMRHLLVCTTVSTLISEFISVISISSEYTLPNPFASAESIAMFDNVHAYIPLIVFAIFAVLLRLTAAIFFSLLVCGISELLEKRLPTMVISTAILVFPAMIGNMNADSPLYCGLDSVMDGGKIIVLLVTSGGILPAVTVLFVFSFAAVFITSLSSAKWNCGTTVK